MPTFPKKEYEVVALAEAMVGGYTAYAADFPSVTVAGLQTVLADYQAAKIAQDSAKSQMQLATEAKDSVLAQLVSEMRNDLKLSEVDVSTDPTRLTEIGWGTKAPPQPLAAPGQPESFVPVAEGVGFVWVSWNKPLTGGRVSSYIIQRRQQSEAGFTDWQLVTTSYSTSIKVTDQPCGVTLEYRCVATNAAGESLPSNSATVVL